MIVDDFLVNQEISADAITYSLPIYETLRNELNTTLGLNICTLGALVGLTNIVSPDSIKNTLTDSFPETYLDLNFKAFEIGMKLTEGKKKFSL